MASGLKNGNNRILDPWRVIDGRCGLLATQRNVCVDRLAVLLVGICRRRNYAYDYSDFRVFEREIIGSGNWPIASCATSFFNVVRGSQCSGKILQSIFPRMLKCLVRIYEYLSIAWYSRFRPQAQNFDVRD